MKKLSLIFGFSMGLACALAGCGSDGFGLSGSSSSTSLSYNFSLNVPGINCTTGQQTFSSTADYCAGLQNAAANNNCAQCQRQSTFSQRCSGNFQNALLNCNTNPNQ